MRGEKRFESVMQQHPNNSTVSDSHGTKCHRKYMYYKTTGLTINCKIKKNYNAHETMKTGDQVAHECKAE